MGLCKCPQRKVTNIFCFEHRVNVCEHCLVANHSRDYVKQLPANTAPAGYQCPICSHCIFPAPNQAGPVAEQLLNAIQNEDWARAGLGLSVVDHSHDSVSATNVVLDQTINSQVAATQSVAEIISNHPAFMPQNNLSENSAVTRHASSQKKDSPAAINIGLDADENKYQRRSPLVWLRTYLRSMKREAASVGNAPSRRKRRLLAFVFLLILLVLTVLTVLKALGHNAAENDPMLDPFRNPNVRVGAQ